MSKSFYVFLKYLFSIFTICFLFFANCSFSSVYARTVINADVLNSNKNNSTFSAKGDVQLTRDNYKVNADEVVYDNVENKIFLKSKTKLKDTNNNNIFAEEGVISNDMMYGEFKNAGIILENGISIISPKIIKQNDEKYLIEKSNYYFCPNNNLNIDLSYDDIVKEIKKNRLQLFSIYSKQSVIDKEKNKIFLNHVFFKFMNIPFFYIPYISTTKPFNANVSGLSSPSINSNSDYGYSISLPYKFYTKNDSLFLFSTEFFNGGNFILGLNFKLNNNNNNFKFKFDYIYDNYKSKDFLNDYNVSEFNEGVYNNNRFLFELDFNGSYEDDIFYNSDIKIVNDKYLLRDYYNDYSKVLQSNLNITKLKDSGYLTFKAVSFQQLREDEHFETIDNIQFIPKVDYFYNQTLFTEKNKQLKFNFLSNIRSISNTDNNGYTNLNLSPNLNYIYNNLNIDFESNITANFNSYNYFNNNYNLYDKYRFNPELELKLILPFNILDNFFVKTKIQYFFSDSKKFDYINSDSYDSELTLNNLFTSNRYSGYDLIEYGSRLNYGLEANLITNFGNFNFFIAQGYREKIDENNNIVNFENNLSSILTNFYYNYNDIFVNFISTINSKNYNYDRKELLIEGSLNRSSFGLSFVDLLNYTDSEYNQYTKEKQLNLNLSYEFVNHFFVDFEVNNNLEYNKITLLKTGIRYEDECFRILATMNKVDYVDSTNESNVSFNLNFRLKGN